MNAVDTNILLYAHDPRAPEKQDAATTLIQELRDGVLLWQVACEYLAASRKLAPLGYSLDGAYEDLLDLRHAWFTALPTWATLDRGWELMQRHGLSFWDATLVAASLDAQVTQLFSEDFGAPREIEGLRIVNPFKNGS
jgi:predicted nucleic acid-binding protein